MNTILIFHLSALVFVITLLVILVTELIIKKKQLNNKDLEHLKILQGHLELYKDCIQQGQIEMLSTFIESTLHTVNKSINLLEEKGK